jgi:hypothetical protein
VQVVFNGEIDRIVIESFTGAAAPARSLTLLDRPVRDVVGSITA